MVSLGFGFKLPLLCRSCEELLNKCETQTANEVFHPINHSQPGIIRYEGEWLLKFAVSVSWRSLIYWMEASKEHSLSSSKESLALINKCLRTWREFLLDKRPHPGVYQQHMILFDSIESASSTEGIPANINRFLLRGMHINVAATAGQPAFIFTKMARMFLFGFINISYPRQWIGTKIQVKRGQLRGDLRISSGVFDYLIERAQVEHAELQQISTTQWEKIAASYRQNPKRVAASETFKAMDHDVRLFGDRAFYYNDEDSDFKP